MPVVDPDRIRRHNRPLAVKLRKLGGYLQVLACLAACALSFYSFQGGNYDMLFLPWLHLKLYAAVCLVALAVTLWSVYHRSQWSRSERWDEFYRSSLGDKFFLILGFAFLLGLLASVILGAMLMTAKQLASEPMPITARVYKKKLSYQKDTCRHQVGIVIGERAWDHLCTSAAVYNSLKLGTQSISIRRTPIGDLIEPPKPSS